MEELDPKGPVLVGIGGSGAQIVSKASPDSVILDTDSRTRYLYPRHKVLILGEEVLGGEGAGRNLKLGMIAFRSGMDVIERTILPRMPVIIVAGCEGGTGLSGAVELNSHLARTGIPRFNFIVLEDHPNPEPGREAMALALIGSILHPGAIVKNVDIDKLSEGIGLLYEASIPTPGFRIPSGSWSRLSSGKSPYDMEIVKIDMDETVSDGKGPSQRGLSLAAVSYPEGTPVTELKRIVEYHLGFGDNINVGMVHGGKGKLTLVSLSEPVNPGPIPNPGTIPDLQELLGSETMDISPVHEKLH